MISKKLIRGKLQNREMFITETLNFSLTRPDWQNAGQITTQLEIIRVHKKVNDFDPRIQGGGL